VIILSSIFSLNIINKLIFVTVKCCVFFEVRTGFLNILLLDLLPLQTVKYKF
jgi:hypothetical protein